MGDYRNPKTRRVNLRIEQSLWDSISLEAKQRNCSCSDIVRDRLRDTSLLHRLETKMDELNARLDPAQIRIAPMVRRAAGVPTGVQR